MMKGHHHQDLWQSRGLAPIRTAVVHPVDTVSLLGAIEAAKEKLIVPVLVGPEAKIRAAAAAGQARPLRLRARADRAQPRGGGRRRSRWRATARSRR